MPKGYQRLHQSDEHIPEEQKEISQKEIDKIRREIKDIKSEKIDSFETDAQVIYLDNSYRSTLKEYLTITQQLERRIREQINQPTFSLVRHSILNESDRDKVQENFRIKSSDTKTIQQLIKIQNNSSRFISKLKDFQKTSLLKNNAVSDIKNDIEALIEISDYRKNMVDAITEYKIKYDYCSGGYTSYLSEVINNSLGLACSVAYCWPFIYDMMRISTTVFLTELCDVKKPSADIINSFSAVLSGLVFLSNIMGFDVRGSAKAAVRQEIDNPDETLWKLIKKNPWLSVCMFKHFFDGSYPGVLQLVNYMDRTNLSILSVFLIYSGIRYYLPYSARKTLVGGEKLEQHPSILKHLWESLCALELKEAGADLYVFLLQSVTLVVRMANYGYSGFKQLTQFTTYFLPELGTPTGITYGLTSSFSAFFAGAATIVPANNTRGLALRQQFHNVDLTEDEYAKAKEIYDNRSVNKKILDELVRFFLSPSTFINLPIVFAAYKDYCSGDLDEFWAVGYSLLATMLHGAYREAAKRQDITSIANKLGEKEDEIVPNILAKLSACVLQLSEQLSRVGASVVSILTLLLGDYFSSPDLEKLEKAPKCSFDFMLLIYCFSAIVSAGNFPFMYEQNENSFLHLSPRFFGRQSQAALKKLAEMKDELKPSNIKEQDDLEAQYMLIQDNDDQGDSKNTDKLDTIDNKDNIDSTATSSHHVMKHHDEEEDAESSWALKSRCVVM